jgi:hypothetical protein
MTRFTCHGTYVGRTPSGDGFLGNDPEKICSHRERHEDGASFGFFIIYHIFRKNQSLIGPQSGISVMQQIKLLSGG